MTIKQRQKAQVYNMQTIQPATDYVFCKTTEANKVTGSGFIIPEQAAQKPKTANVINVGSGVNEYTRDDLIVYKQYTVSEITLDRVDYLIIHKDDILGVVKEASL